MKETFRNFVADSYATLAKGVLPGQVCPKCGAKRYMYTTICQKCGHIGLEDIELKPEGTLMIFSPIPGALPYFDKYVKVNGEKVQNLKGYEGTPATSEYVWGEVILDDGPNIFCFVKGFGIMMTHELEPAMKTLPRRVRINLEMVEGNNIPIAELAD